MAFDLSSLTPEQIGALTPDTLAMLMGNHAEADVKVTSKPKVKDIPSAIVKLDDGLRVRMDQRYQWGNAEKGGAFKSHGGFRVHIEVLAEDGTVAKDAKPVNVTGDMVRAIRKLTDAQAKALTVNALT